jgi:chromosome partitioning protein
MSIIAVATQKGGTAKTTTTINVAAALKRMGYSVLLIDSDPQCNLTYSLGVTDDCELNLYTEYKKEITGQKSELRDAIRETQSGLKLIPSSIELANAELELVSKFAREYTLRNRMLKPLLNEYDFIFIDCPPSFGMLTVNALVATDHILIPLTGEFLPRKGVESFLRLLQTMRDMLEVKAQVVGFVLTRYSPRKKMNQEVKEWLEHSLPYPLFKTFIHTDIRLAVAQKRGEDIFTFAPHSAGAKDYEALAVEFIETISAIKGEPKAAAAPEPVLT